MGEAADDQKVPAEGLERFEDAREVEVAPVAEGVQYRMSMPVGA